MISFAKEKLGWLNKAVRNTSISTKDKIAPKHSEPDTKENHIKNTDINVLLNRVKLNQKNESRKKIYFSAAASAGLLIFGIVIF
tara:strand:- start:135 stop:386 length:252 start_codon:yes stop_codon:yes gene_type:complete